MFDSLIQEVMRTEKLLMEARAVQEKAKAESRQHPEDYGKLSTPHSIAVGNAIAAREAAGKAYDEALSNLYEAEKAFALKCKRGTNAR